MKNSVSARQLYKSLGYLRWENFNNLIIKAMQLIRNGLCHGSIIETRKRIEIGSGACREVVDYQLDEKAIELINNMAYNKCKKSTMYRNETMMLSTLMRYCSLRKISFEEQFSLGKYKFDCRVNRKILIEYDEPHHRKTGQNTTDVKKDEIAHLNGYTLFRYDTTADIINMISDIENDITKSYRFKGYMSTLNIATKNLATEITNFNVDKEDLQGETAITNEHIQNNQSVRKMLEQRGIKPEELPPEEDIQKLERRVKSDSKRVEKQSSKLPKQKKS